MTIEELSTKAANNEAAPDGLILPEMWLYEALRHLYGLYSIQKISRSEASTEKKKAIEEFEHGMMIWNLYDGMCKTRVQLAKLKGKVDPNKCPALLLIDNRLQHDLRPEDFEECEREGINGILKTKENE